MRLFYLTTSLWLALVFPALAQEYTPARLIENSNPQYHQFKDQSRVEGWVFANYILDVDGQAKHITIIDKSENSDVYPEFVHHLNNLHYMPATVGKKPVPSAKSSFFQTLRTPTPANEIGISDDFRHHYKLASKYIENKEFDQAKQNLDQMRQHHSKNLKEQAFSALLHSQYYYSRGNWSAYDKHIRVATLLKEMLPVKSAIAAVQNSIQRHAFKKEYAAAFSALASLKKIKGARISESVYQGMHLDLFILLRDDINIEVNHSFTENPVWLHQMSRQQLNLTRQQGKINSIELRCKNKRSILTENEVKALTLSEQDRYCSLLIEAAIGTSISLMESGELY